MEYSRPLISITSDGSLLAIINGGREVCVWDATNGKQICKISNSTWSAVLSLVWAPSHSKAPIGTRKKRKRLTNPSPGTPSLIAIGSNRGLVVWDVIRNEEHVTMPEDGCGGVVSSYWNGPDSLYMCDGSKEAFYWSIGKDSLDRWKADKRGVSCITMRSHGDVILTAGKSIKLWDSTNHTLIKRFSGHHFTDIFSMSFVTPIHFISAAANDRYICLWNSETGSATSLVCEKDLMAVHSTCEDNEQEMIKIVSVCQDGLLHLYTLESHNHKVASDPILPSTTIQFVQDGKSQQETPLPVLAAHLTIKNDILIAHSSIIRPVFENISFEQPEGRVCLTRACPKGLILPPGQDDDDKGQTTSTQISSASTLVGHTNPRSFPWKQDNEDNNSKDLSMMDRLNSLSLDHQTRNEKHNTESLSLLVIQGVHSGDKQMLEQIFNIKHDRLINATVRKLPITVVVPFLKILIDLINSRPSRASQLTHWIQSLLFNHTAYLLTVPHLLDSLTTLYQSLESRTSLFSKLSKLQGKLDLVLAQTESEENDTDDLLKPLNIIRASEDLIYKNEISEDEDNFDNEDEEDHIMDVEL